MDVLRIVESMVMQFLFKFILLHFDLEKEQRWIPVSRAGK